MNKPMVIGLAVAAVLIAALIIWKTMFADPYGAPPPIATGAPGAAAGPSGGKPAMTLPNAPPSSDHTGGLSMPPMPTGR